MVPWARPSLYPIADWIIQVNAHSIVRAALALGRDVHLEHRHSGIKQAIREMEQTKNLLAMVCLAG